MKTKKRQKLCHNCDGEIDLDVIVCPFCAADLREEKPELGRPTYSSSLMQRNAQTNQSLYPAKGEEIKTFQDTMEVPEEAALSPPVVDPSKNIFGPTILFTLGVQLFLLGFLMLLFSHKGVVVLKWDAHFWFWYVLAAVPFLYFGYKAILKL